MNPHWERTLGSLRRFAKLHGSLKPLKLRFRVPENDPQWPSDLRGYCLGGVVNNLRKRGPQFYARNNPSFFRELQAMGFLWSAVQERDRKLLLALRTYKSIHGDLHVPTKFVVPQRDPQWPEELWNLKLGFVVKNIRNTGNNRRLHAQLEELGFDFDFQKKPHDFEDIFQGLVAFKREFGHFLVPRGFVVGEDDARFPPGLRGCAFGSVVYTMIIKGYYFKEHRERLLSIGFTRKSRAELKFDIIFEALRCYRRLHGHVCIPDKFVVPRDSKLFPPVVWGIQLGKRSRTMVNSKCYQPFLPKLKELGFDVDAIQESRPFSNLLEGKDRQRFL